MSKRNNGTHPALKHGGYSGTTLLPGEDPAAFDKLHKDLITELAPAGRLEADIVETMARLIWRKQNLKSYHLAKQAKARYSEIDAELAPPYPDFGLPDVPTRDNQEVYEAALAAEEQARKELGKAWDLVEMDDDSTIEHMLDEWSVVDRLDGMIDRCIKRLLMVRGVKSMSSSSIALSPPRKRLAAV
jgi:hypothetical protein